MTWQELAEHINSMSIGERNSEIIALDLNERPATIEARVSDTDYYADPSISPYLCAAHEVYDEDVLKADPAFRAGQSFLYYDISE